MEFEKLKSFDELLKEKDERTFNYLKKVQSDLGYIKTESTFDKKIYKDEQIIKKITIT